MSLPSYRPSGRCPPLRGALVLMIGAVLFAGLGAGEQLLIEGLIGEDPAYGAAVSLALIVKVGGLISGAVLASLLVARAPCRWPLLAWGLGLLWGLSALVAGHGVVRAAGRWGSRLERGRVVASRRAWFEIALPGSAVPWLWLGEALLVSSVLPLAARSQSRRPFIEAEGVWAEEERRGRLPGMSAEGVRALGRARTVGELIQAPSRFPDAAGPRLKFSLVTGSAAGGAWLSVFEGEGRVLWREVTLTEAQLGVFLARNTLEAWFESGGDDER